MPEAENAPMPLNGLVTAAVSRLIAVWSRLGVVLSQARGDGVVLASDGHARQAVAHVAKVEHRASGKLALYGEGPVLQIGVGPVGGLERDGLSQVSRQPDRARV